MSVKKIDSQWAILSADRGTPMFGIAMVILWLLPKWVIGTTAVLWLLFYVVEVLARHNSLYPRTFNCIYQTFWFIDVVFNATTGSLWFLELPKGAPHWYIETFSDRLRRHYRHERGWRYHLAALFSGPINNISRGHI
jgi:hypothetical protein